MGNLALRRLSVHKVSVLNGVNLGALGTRRPEIYGTLTLGDIEGMLRERHPDVDFEFRQTDHEGEMVGYVREARGSDGILINPGAWSHYSYAIHDALQAVEGVLKLEVHLSNVHAREPWRRHSVISPAVGVVVAGMGRYGYEAAVGYVLNRSDAR
jgi:3-dehydroquinate dehydratase-2